MNQTYKAILLPYALQPSLPTWGGQGGVGSYYAAWICRFVSVDPLQFKYTHYTPYQYAGNKPISYIDLDGGEEKKVVEKLYTRKFLKNNKSSTELLLGQAITIFNLLKDEGFSNHAAALIVGQKIGESGWKTSETDINKHNFFGMLSHGKK